MRISQNEQTKVTAVLEPHYWVDISTRAPAERKDLMVVLNNLEGVYLRDGFISQVEPIGIRIRSCLHQL